MFEEIPKIQAEHISNILHEKGYYNMTFEELQNAVLVLDKRLDKLIAHSLMDSKEKILDFLYSWEWSRIYG